MERKIGITMAMAVLGLLVTYLVIGANALPPENNEVQPANEEPAVTGVQAGDYGGCDGSGSCRASCGCGCGGKPKFCGCSGG